VVSELAGEAGCFTPPPPAAQVGFGIVSKEKTMKVRSLPLVFVAIVMAVFCFNSLMRADEKKAQDRPENQKREITIQKHYCQFVNESSRVVLMEVAGLHAGYRTPRLYPPGVGIPDFEYLYAGERYVVVYDVDTGKITDAKPVTVDKGKKFTVKTGGKVEITDW
jgi:hypothetical protein